MANKCEQTNFTNFSSETNFKVDQNTFTVFFSRPWTTDAFYDNETNEDLKQVIRRLLSANEVLEHETAINRLRDEHTTSIFVKVASKIFEAVEIIHESITLDEILPSLSLVVTVVFILVGGYVMSYLVKMEEESVRKQLGAKGLKVNNIKIKY